MRARSSVAIFYAFVANIIVGIAKGGAAWYTGSSTLLAETLHTFADSGNQILLWVGMARARKPATTRHPLGHGKELYFWSFIVALLLFFGGGAAAIIEGVEQLRHPVAIANGWVALTTLAFALVCEAISLRAALSEVRSVHDLKTFYRWFRETWRSELLVVVTEDIAAVLSLAIALIAVTASLMTHRTELDAIGSIAIGLLLLVAASSVLIEVKALLIGESAQQRTREATSAELEACEGVVKVRKLITLQYGRDVFVAANIKVTRKSMTHVDTLLRHCHRRLREQNAAIRHVFIEPSA